MNFKAGDMIEGTLGKGIGRIYGQVIETKKKVHVKVRCDYGMPAIRKMWVSPNSIKLEER